MTTPPHEHEHCDESSSADTPPIVTCGDPGVQGVRTGTHGCGLSAAATAGLATDVHRPNGGTFAGATSVTTPAGAVADTRAPDAANVDGIVPNEHCSAAPVHTWLGIRPTPGLTTPRIG